MSQIGAATLTGPLTRTVAAARSVLVTRGRWRFPALGYTLRGVKAMPEPARELVLDLIGRRIGAALPEFADALRLLETAQGVPDGRLWQRRLLVDRPWLREVRTRDVRDDEDGRLRARVYLPPPDAAPAAAALVWVHGGAFLLGNLEPPEAHWVAMELAASGVPVLSADYRWCLGGVHYPAPLDDVLTAWRWAVDHADDLGVRADQLHLGGASAGGCLAASATLRLRDGGRPLPASLCLAYPVLQGELPPASDEVAAELASLMLLTDDLVAGMFANWAGDAPHDDPYVSPGLADPTGLPPTLVISCAHDALRRASEPWAERVRDAGVPVHHHLLAGSAHAPLARLGAPDAEEALETLREWLGRWSP